MILLTGSALKELTRLLNKASESSKIAGIYFGIKAGGCNGFEYVLRPVSESEIKPEDTVLNFENFVMYIHRKSIPFVTGTTIDWNLLGFSFNNPRTESTCGCGISFQPKENEENK